MLKIPLAQKYLSKFRRLLIKLHHKYESRFTDTFDSIDLALGEMDRAVDHIEANAEEFTRTGKCDIAFELYDAAIALNTHAEDILRMLRVLDIGKVGLNLTYSDQYIHEVAKHVVSFSQVVRSFLTDAIEYDSKLRIVFNREVRLPDDAQSAFAVIREAYLHHPRAVGLYVDMLQNQITEVSAQPKGKIIVFKSLIDIEHDKTAVLRLPLELSVSKFDNPIIRTFGFIPYGQGRPLAELLSQFSGKSIGTIKSAIRECGVNIIIINKIIQKPVEFSITNLLEGSTAITISGIDRKFTDQIKTVHYRKSSGSWNFQTHIYTTTEIGRGSKVGGFAESDSFLLFETIDGKNYRPLLPWNAKDLTKIPYFRCQQLLNYVTERNRGVCEPSRVDYYNTHMNRRMMSALFADIKYNRSKIDAISMSIDTQLLRSDLKLALIGELFAELDAGIEISESRYRQLLQQSSRLSSKFAEILLKHYKIIEGRANTSNDEMFVEFMMNTQQMTGEFARDLFMKYDDHRLSPDTFTTVDRTRLKAIIRDNFGTIVDQVLVKFFSGSTNIFRRSVYRSLVLQSCTK